MVEGGILTQKVLGWFGGHGLKGTVGYFTSTGIPLPVAYLVCFGELLGGIGLIFGLLTRLAALGVAIVQLGAMVNGAPAERILHELGADARQGARVRDQPGAPGHVIAGGGALSIDRLLLH